jgi:hypothetical protein
LDCQLPLPDFGLKINKPKLFSFEWVMRKILGKKTHQVLSMVHVSLDGWFYSALLHSRRVDNDVMGTYYEFGVGEGRSLAIFLKALDSFCSDYKIDPSKFRIFAFDTFEGLPEPTHSSDKKAGWYKGLFGHSVSEIKDRLSYYGVDYKKFNIRFIEGNFDQTLTTSLRKELEEFPPTIVNVDVDYYSSSKTVLEWLRPILSSGVKFYFDDIWAFAGNPNYGELRSIKEFNEVNDGFLTPYPVLGMPGDVYIYSKQEYEFT